MDRIIVFALKIYTEVKKDDLFSAANTLTYKMLLSLFPFVLILMSMLSYFEIDPNYLISSLKGSLPDGIMDVVIPFIIDLTQIKRPSILSVSIVFLLYSASGGFNTVMQGINKAYGQKDSRNFLHRRLVSVILLIFFIISIVFSLVMLIFSDNIYHIVKEYFHNSEALDIIFSFVGYMLTVGVFLICVMAINSLALARKKRPSELFPGSCFTVVCWVVLSWAFNIYVNNFSRYSTLYGSVAGIMLLMMWLNLICIFLLIGSEINALLSQSSD